MGKKLFVNRANEKLLPMPIKYFCEGKLLGAFCAVCGVLVMALPIPIVVDNFADYYSEQKKLEAEALKREAKVGDLVMNISIAVFEQSEEEQWQEKNALLAKERLLETISQSSKTWDEKIEDEKVINGYVK